MPRRAHVRLLAAVAAFAVAIPGLFAGPLNPPAGPIASTLKPLSDVEPRTAMNAANTPGDASSVFKITQPGSYYLTDNLTGVSGKHGIAIAASNVTIDLAGFGVLGAVGSLVGVFDSMGDTGVVLRNGLVSGWGGSGVDLSSVDNTLVEGVISRSNGGFGIRAGSYSVIRFCTAGANASTGIIAFDGGVVESCVAVGNSSNGFAVGPGTVIRGCVARVNTSNGFNSTSSSATVIDCTAYQNDGTGFNVAGGSTVERCVASQNGLDGITAGGACTLRDNACAGNGLAAAGGAGIHVTGSDCRVEGNNCTGADRGVDVDSAGNIIVRNTCSGNTTNWDLVANNVFGPIIDRTAPASPAVSGNAAASSLASTDANANFTY
jgi:parallel beta-helix repeat protein